MPDLQLSRRLHKIFCLSVPGLQLSRSLRTIFQPRPARQVCVCRRDNAGDDPESGIVPLLCICFGDMEVDNGICLVGSSAFRHFRGDRCGHLAIICTISRLSATISRLSATISRLSIVSSEYLYKNFMVWRWWHWNCFCLTLAEV